MSTSSTIVRFVLQLYILWSFQSTIMPAPIIGYAFARALKSDGRTGDIFINDVAMPVTRLTIASRELLQYCRTPDLGCYTGSECPGENCDCRPNDDGPYGGRGMCIKIPQIS